MTVDPKLIFPNPYYFEIPYADEDYCKKTALLFDNLEPFFYHQINYGAIYKRFIYINEIKPRCLAKNKFSFFLTKDFHFFEYVDSAEPYFIQKVCNPIFKNISFEQQSNYLYLLNKKTSITKDEFYQIPLELIANMCIIHFLVNERTISIINYLIKGKYNIPFPHKNINNRALLNTSSFKEENQLKTKTKKIKFYVNTSETIQAIITNKERAVQQ